MCSSTCSFMLGGIIVYVVKSLVSSLSQRHDEVKYKLFRGFACILYILQVFTFQYVPRVPFLVGGKQSALDTLPDGFFRHAHISRKGVDSPYRFMRIIHELLQAVHRNCLGFFSSNHLCVQLKTVQAHAQWWRCKLQLQLGCPSHSGCGYGFHDPCHTPG